MTTSWLIMRAFASRVVSFPAHALDNRRLRTARTARIVKTRARRFVCRRRPRGIVRLAQAPAVEIFLRRSRLGALRCDYGFAGILSHPGGDGNLTRVGMGNRARAR